MRKRDGGCLCGAMRYRLEDEPIFVNCCHCTECQRMTGSAFALNAMIETDRLTITAGALEVRTVNSGRGWHCPHCATLLWADHRMMGDGLRFLRVGTLDEAATLEPSAHYFVRSKRGWVSIPDGVPAFETLPKGDPAEGMDMSQRARVAAAMPAGALSPAN